MRRNSMLRKQAFGGKKIANPFGEQNNEDSKPVNPPAKMNKSTTSPFGAQKNEEVTKPLEVKKNNSRPTGKLPTDAFSGK